MADFRRMLAVAWADWWRLTLAALGTLFWFTSLYLESLPNPRASLPCVLTALALWAIALFRPWRLKAPDRYTGIAVLLIAAAIVPRAVLLEQAPYGFYHDEVIDPMLGLELLQEEPWEILRATSWYFDQPRFTEALQAWPCLYLQPLLGARVASVILAIASLLATFALGRRMFGCRSALLGLSFLILSPWHILYSRMGYPYMQPMFFVPCCLYLVLTSHEKRNDFFGLLGGVFVGLSVLAYTPARVVLPVLALWLVHCVLTGKLSYRRAATSTAIVLLGAVIILSPYLSNVGLGGILQRWSETTKKHGSPVLVLQEHGWTSSEGVAALGRNLVEAGEMYVEYGEEPWAGVEHGLGHSLVDPFTLSFFALGFIIAISRSRDSNYGLLVVWIAITFVLAQVLTDLPKAAYRPTPLLPALCLCAGLAGDFISRWFRRRHLGLALVIATLAVGVLPKTATYIDEYMKLRSVDSTASLARLAAAHPPYHIYYAVTTAPIVDRPEISFYTSPRKCLDVPSLLDTLAEGIDRRNDAMFLLSPAMAPAAEVIQACYPGSTLLAESGHPRFEAVLAVRVPRAALAARPPCSGAEAGFGLYARYYAGTSWDGELLLERQESWPYRYRDPFDSFGSVLWSGRLRVPSRGRYTFELLKLRGATGEVSIGSGLTFDQDAEIDLEVGEYPITIRCRPENPAAGCWLNWQPPGYRRELIPPRFMAPDAAFAVH